MKANLSFEQIVAASEQVSWRLDDVIPPDVTINFSQPFLPRVLAPLDDLDGLTAAEALRLNQIQGHGYLHLFRFVEEYIIATAVNHAHAELFGDPYAMRALLRFADEELKHQQMFTRVIDAVRAGFPANLHGLGSAAEVAGRIMTRSQLAVLMVTLHLELVTQKHFVEAFKSAREHDVEPTFKRMLQHHWMEEAQHSKIDTLELGRLLENASAEMRGAALTQYEALLTDLDELLAQQAELDLRTLWQAIGRELPSESRARLQRWHHQTYRQLFILHGLQHPDMLEVAARVHASAPDRMTVLAGRLAA